MSTYFFELDGCTSANLAGVEASLGNVPARCAIHRTARGSFILSTDSDQTLEQLSAFISSVLIKPVKAIAATSLPSTILRR